MGVFSRVLSSELFRYSFGNAFGLLVAGGVGSITYEKYKQENEYQRKMIADTSKLIDQQREGNKTTLLHLLQSQWVSRLAHHMHGKDGLSNKLSGILQEDTAIFSRMLELQRHLNALDSHKKRARLQHKLGLHEQTTSDLHHLEMDCQNQLKLLSAARSIAQALHYYKVENLAAASEQIQRAINTVGATYKEIDHLILSMAHNVSSMIHRRQAELQTSDQYSEAKKIQLLSLALSEGKESINHIEQAANYSSKNLARLSPNNNLAKAEQDPSLELYKFSAKKSIGIAHLKLGQYEEAQSIFSTMIDHDGKEDLEVLTCLGIILGQLAQQATHADKKTEYTTLSGDYLDRAVSLDASNAGLLSNRGAYHHLGVGNLKQAEADLSTANKNRPDEIDIQFNQAALYFKQGKTREALELFEKIDEKVKSKNTLVKYFKLLIHSELGNDDAKESFQSTARLLASLEQTFDEVESQSNTAKGIDCHATFDEHRIPCKALREDLDAWEKIMSSSNTYAQAFKSAHPLFRRPSTQTWGEWAMSFMTSSP
jgi:tetratricopeptide (TPR) repeat protein